MSATTEKVHLALIKIIKEYAANSNDAIAQKIVQLSNETLIRQMFSNFRGSEGNGTRGLRLTNFGLTIMKNYFKGYEQKMPEGSSLKTLHVLYLDQHASMPYYCSNEGFYIFDHDLGIKLKLADGHIETLMEIENVRAMMESS